MSFDITGTLRIIDQATRPLRSMTSSIMKFGVAAAGIGAVAGTFAVVGDSIKKAMDFESQMQTIKALTGASADEMGRLNALALEQGALTKYSALEAAQGMEELLKSGLTVDQVENGGLNAALNLATAGSLELADAAEIMSTALNAYSKDNMTAAEASDILAGTANASATSVQELRYSLSAVSAVAAGVGMTFKDTNTALGLFANNGLKGSDAGTSLKTMLANLVPMTDKAYALFEEFNLLTVDTNASLEFLASKGIKSTGTSLEQVTSDVEKYVAGLKGLKVGSSKAAKETQKFLMANNLIHSAFYDERGEIKKLTEVAGILQDRFKDLTGEQRQYYMYQLFGSDAIRAGNILFKEGAEGVQKFYDEMGKVTALQVAEEKMNSAAGAVEQFRGAVETLQISALTPLMPVIRRLAGKAAKMVAEWTPQITAAVENMVSTATKYVEDNFINNPEFKNLPDLESKIQFTFGKIGEAFNLWWEGGGKQKTESVTKAMVGFVINVTESMTPQIVAVALKIGGAIVTGIMQGIKDNLNVVDLMNPFKREMEKFYAEYSNAEKLKNNLDKWSKENPGKPMIEGGTIGPSSQPDSLWGKFTNAIGFSGGLDNVPYNNYPARLHEGEMVLTSAEARAYRQGNGGSPSVVITGNTFNVRSDGDIEAIANALAVRLAM
ncbi:phage tail tape measure protein [Paenibacillus sp. FSL W8-0426]|uniref:phage tail tape measure protein n=1 Tax=Paenibacillus sp. FSL W8-0426 TaxID=2921714 RepID=UPI0030D878BB